MKKIVAADSAEYMRKFNARAIAEHVPLSGTIDLTHRCNLGCVHCYLGDRRKGRPRGEMSTEQVISVVDDIADAGCLFLLFSGGDPLLRPDFEQVYRHTVERGILPTVFTNGTLIGEEHTGLFRELPPRCVEITLYGATKETYERITQVAGSYEDCIRGVELLLDKGVRTRLKTVTMTLNRHEFDDIRTIADRYGVPFRADPQLTACFDGACGPTKLRIAPKDAVDLEWSLTKHMKSRRAYWEENRDKALPDRLYTCGAGRHNFYIDPTGNLQPCLMPTGISYDLLGGTFVDGWRNTIPKIMDIGAPEEYTCRGCDKRALCDSCPAFAMLENGDANAPPEYLCAIGQERYLRMTAE